MKSLSNKALLRIANFYQLASPVNMGEVEEEYGDLSDYDLPEEIDYNGLTEEEFIQGELVMALAGWEVEDMTDEEKVQALLKNPHLLKLTPKYNVYGKWYHTIRETDIEEIEEVTNNIRSSNEEICVTDANKEAFWEFSEYRRFSLIFEGTCVVLWNADVYSSKEDGILQFRNQKNIEYIDKMTEGWIVPSNCSLIGLDFKPGSVSNDEYYKLLQIAKEMGVSIGLDSSVENVIQSIDLIEMDEVERYLDIPKFTYPELVDTETTPWNAEVYLNKINDPGDLYEEVFDQDEGYGNVSVKDLLSRSLVDNISHNNFDKVKELVYNGADVNHNGAPLTQATEKRNYAITKFLLENGADPNLINPRISFLSFYKEYEIISLLFEYGYKLREGEEKYAIVAFKDEVPTFLHLMLDQGVLNTMSPDSYQDLISILRRKITIPQQRNSEVLHMLKRYVDNMEKPSEISNDYWEALIYYLDRGTTN